MAATPVHIGMLIYPRVDQLDFTGPYEVLSRIPGSVMHVVWKDKTPLRDVRGLILTPEETLSDAPKLDILVIPGGYGQEDLMEDESILEFLRARAAEAQYTLSVCTGALLCGAAGLLRGARATTHWTAFSLLEYYGAIPTDERVVVDGRHVSAAGVTAGLDGALQAAALLAGREAAERIQLSLEYAPEPPFASGRPSTAPAAVLEAVTAMTRPMSERRLETARRIARKLGSAIARS